MLHFEDYVQGLEDHCSLIWEAMTVQTVEHTGTRNVFKTQAYYNNLLLEVKDAPHDEKDKPNSNVKALRIIIFALPPESFPLVSAYETTK